jgi:hypothetical protein
MPAAGGRGEPPEAAFRGEAPGKLGKRFDLLKPTSSRIDQVDLTWPASRSVNQQDPELGLVGCGHAGTVCYDLGLASRWACILVDPERAW